MLLVARIGFFALVPLGILAIVHGVRQLIRVFGGPVLLELPYATKRGAFVVPAAGRYAIWQVGPLLSRAPVDEFRPVVRRQDTQQPVGLLPTLFRATSSGGDGVSTELFTFEASPGAYELVLEAGSSIWGVEALLAKALPLKPDATRNYRLQIRQSAPFYAGLLGTVLCVLGALGCLGGAIAGVLAPSFIP